MNLISCLHLLVLIIRNDRSDLCRKHSKKDNCSNQGGERRDFAVKRRLA